ncbi:hypothetical protein LTR05_004165 [Lithohypha guttulata]|uniref:Uncharacterized protein n=1 Tax=Lithohypha guttulata TaxID=1690604 RepID=A0AAN7T2F5_9EURO|nr:hypothetical protein LTR05_004165 [Lithohypha guttulata]
MASSPVPVQDSPTGSTDNDVHNDVVDIYTDTRSRNDDGPAEEPSTVAAPESVPGAAVDRAFSSGQVVMIPHLTPSLKQSNQGSQAVGQTEILTSHVGVVEVVERPAIITVVFSNRLHVLPIVPNGPDFSNDAPESAYKLWSMPVFEADEQGTYLLPATYLKLAKNDSKILSFAEGVHISINQTTPVDYTWPLKLVGKLDGDSRRWLHRRLRMLSMLDTENLAGQDQDQELRRLIDTYVLSKGSEQQPSRTGAEASKATKSTPKKTKKATQPAAKKPAAKTDEPKNSGDNDANQDDAPLGDTSTASEQGSGEQNNNTPATSSGIGPIPLGLAAKNFLHDGRKVTWQLLNGKHKCAHFKPKCLQAQCNDKCCKDGTGEKPSGRPVFDSQGNLISTPIKKKSAPRPSKPKPAVTAQSSTALEDASNAGDASDDEHVVTTDQESDATTGLTESAQPTKPIKESLKRKACESTATDQETTKEDDKPKPKRRKTSGAKSNSIAKSAAQDTGSSRRGSTVMTRSRSNSTTIPSPRHGTLPPDDPNSSRHSSASTTASNRALKERLEKEFTPIETSILYTADKSVRSATPARSARSKSAENDSPPARRTSAEPQLEPVFESVDSEIELDEVVSTTVVEEQSVTATIPGLAEEEPQLALVTTTQATHVLKESVVEEQHVQVEETTISPLELDAAVSTQGNSEGSESGIIGDNEEDEELK